MCCSDNHKLFHATNSHSLLAENGLSQSAEIHMNSLGRNLSCIEMKASKSRGWYSRFTVASILHINGLKTNM